MRPLAGHHHCHRPLRQAGVGLQPAQAVKLRLPDSFEGHVRFGLGSVGKVQVVREMTVNTEQHADLLSHFARTVGTAAGPITHGAGNHLEKIAGEDRVVG